MKPRPPDFAVVPMTVEDLDLVMEVENRIYPFPWSRGNFADSLRAGHDAWRFVDRAGQMLGYAIVLWSLDEVHLLNLAVDATFQGNGLGGRFLDWLVRDARKRGGAVLLLEVRPSNPRAMRLYQRFGMRRIGVRRGYYPFHAGSREDAIVMQTELPDSLVESNASSR